MKIGVQLYNFRNALKTDFKGTLKEISRMGFDGIVLQSITANSPRMNWPPI